MSLADDLLPPALAFFRCYAFLVSFATLRQQLGPPLVASAALALTAGALPAALRGPAPEATPLLAVVFELLAGFCTALPFALTATLLFSTGRLIDTLRGSLIAEQVLPGLEERASALESAATIGFTALLFASGLWQLPVSLLYRSFELSGAHAAAEMLSAAGVRHLLQLVSCAFRESIFALAPAFVALFAWDIAVMSLSRAAPRLHIQSELSGAKLVFGLAVIALIDWDASDAAALWNRTGGR